MSNKETKSFQAETKQLLDLMIHSVYTHKDIFLRELISNASDAIDKVKFESLKNVDILKGDSDFKIKIEIDKDNKELSIIDNGIGMSYDDVVQNLGTIAKSGTKAFLEKLKDTEDKEESVNLIGQFGVGFYSAFMVGHSVKVLTKTTGDQEAVLWESTGDGTYSIEKSEKETRGTKITITLSEEIIDDKEGTNYLDQHSIETLVKKYSDYISYPIEMDFYSEEYPKDEEGKVIEGKEAEIKIETKVMNSMVPIWERSKSDIKEEEYKEFYKNSFHDWTDPLDIIHTKVEGTVQYNALIYIPSKAPFDLYSKDFEKGLKLYSKRVFIMEKCKELLPDHFRFVRGLVDSPDFSLNISRELLQHGKQLKIIAKNLEKKIISSLKNTLKEDRKKYNDFFNEFGRVLKSGLYMNFQNKDKLSDLLIFESSKSEEKITLAEYVERMKEGQEDIFYVSGKDRSIIEKLPQMELFKEKDYEVLYFTDDIDEFVVQTLMDYNGKKLKSINRGDIDLSKDEAKDEKDKENEDKKDNDKLLELMKKHLENKVSDVKISKRLKTSPVCLVSGDAGISFSMEKVLSEMDNLPMKATRILEINAEHKIYNILEKTFTTDPASPKIKDFADLLYSQALLIEGLPLDDPSEFAKKISNLMIEANV